MTGLTHSNIVKTRLAERKHTSLLPSVQPSRLIFAALVIAIFSSFASVRPCHAGLPAVMHSPQGALDVAAALPGKYGLLARKNRPMSPGENAAESAKAIAGMMRQASAITEMTPMGGAPKAQAAASDRASVGQTLGNISLRPADAALAVASRVPRASVTAAVGAKAMLHASALTWPTNGLIYSTFGASRGKRGHGAIDIVTKKGAPIAASAPGVVAVAANGGKLFKGYGKIIIVDHGEDVHTVYAHCDSIMVKIGQRVSAGEYIGTVGRTGRATTDHCHFEIRVAGKKVDPLKYLPSRPEMVKAHNWKSSSASKKVN